MKLVFVTRKLDQEDPRTGFVFTWINKLAEETEALFVICLEKGRIGPLPPNVRIASMGKEQGKSHWRELKNYWHALGKFLPQSHGVFIHMHPLYAIAAWPLVKFYRKRMVLWYVHKSVDFKLKIAHALVDQVLTASKESFRLPSRKVKVVGHGIDLDKFKVHNPSQPPLIFRGGAEGELRFRIVSVGRISPVKDCETLIKAIGILRDQGIADLELNIYGSAELPDEKTYLDSLINFVREADLEKQIKFQGPLPYDYIDEVYSEADLFMSSSQTGSIDKAVLEAAASGILVLTSNEAFAAPLRQISPFLCFQRDNPHDLAAKISQIKSWPEEKRQDLQQALRAWVERDHNLDNLVKIIINQFN